MMLLKHSNKSLRGSSIVESVIAIAIISICSLVAFMIYLNVIQQNKSTSYYEAMHQIKSLTQTSINEQNFADDTYNYKSYTLNKTVEINKDENIAIIEWQIITGSTSKIIYKIISYEAATD